MASRLPYPAAVSTPSTHARPFPPLIVRPLITARLRAVFDDARTVRPLMRSAGLMWLSCAALAILFYSPAIRVYDAGALPDVRLLRTVAFALAPNALLQASPQSQAPFVMLVYLAIVGAAFGAWCWAMRVARGVPLRSSAPVLLLTTAIALPLLLMPGLVSDDVYLYNMYGRTISAYGANPVVLPPSAFAADPHLPWVHWKHFPSAYGPIWLMLSANVSAGAGDSLTASVLWYRTAALLLHLAVALTLCRLLRRREPATAMPRALFYAWNPLVLHEVVANAHNDVLVALFAVLLVAAAVRSRWRTAAFFGACAVMVKPFAILLFPPLARRIVLRVRGAARAEQLTIAAAVAGATVLAWSLPFHAVVQLVRNAMANPASHMYTNSVWELLSQAGPAWFDVKTVSIQHPYLDVLRGLCFAAGLAWVMTRRASRRDVPRVAFRTWLVFCLTACWVWPWYFVPALALASLAGASQLASAIGLTVGGLLFWTAWPERTVAPLDVLYRWRALILYGPLLLILAVAPVRALALRAAGLRRRPPATGSDPIDVTLQPAA